jgi:hypothetical protein
MNNILLFNEIIPHHGFSSIHMLTPNCFGLAINLFDNVAQTQLNPYNLSTFHLKTIVGLFHLYLGLCCPCVKNPSTHACVL